MQKIKILFIITQSEQGGAQRWVFDTATSLDKNHYEVIVAGGEIHTSRTLLDQLQNADIATRPLTHLVRALRPIKDLRALYELYCLIKKERPDIVQLCSTKAGIIGSIAGALRGHKKIIYRIGGWAFNDPRPRWYNKIFLWLEKITAPLKTCIIVNSQKGYDEALMHRICSKEKITLIYNGVEPAKRHYAPHTEPRQTFTAITIANFYKTKGLEYLLETANLLKNTPINFVIIGEGPERKKLEAYIINNKVYNVCLKGALKNAENYLADYDCLIIPSVKEGIPYVLLEGLASGMPIIATTAGGMPEIIQNKKNGFLVPPKNPASLASAIKQCAESPIFCAKLSHAAQETSMHYTRKAMIQKYNVLLQSQIL